MKASSKNRSKKARRRQRREQQAAELDRVLRLRLAQQPRIPYSQLPWLRRR